MFLGVDALAMSAVLGATSVVALQMQEIHGRRRLPPRTHPEIFVVDLIAVFGRDVDLPPASDGTPAQVVGDLDGPARRAAAKYDL